MTSTGKGVFASGDGGMQQDSAQQEQTDSARLEQQDSAWQNLQSGKGLIGQGKYSEAYNLFANTLQSFSPSMPDDTLLVYLQLEAGLASYLMGAPETATRHYKTILKEEEKWAGRVSPRVWIDANYRLGIAYRELGDLYLAIDYLEAALQQANLGPEKNMDIGKCHNALGNLQIRLRNYELALGHYREAKGIIADKFGPEHLHVASVLGNMGLAYQELDSFQASLDAHFAALEIREKVLRKGHPTIALNHNNLGDTYLAMGELDRAEGEYKTSMDQWRRALGPDHINIAIAEYNLGDVLKQRGEWFLALEAYQRAINVLDPGHATVNWMVEKSGMEPRSYVIYLDALRRKAATLRAMDGVGEIHLDPYLIAGIYQDLHRLVLEMRKGFQREASSRELVSISLGIYEEAIQSCLVPVDSADDQSRILTALNYAEAAKGVSLDAALNSQEALKFTGPVASLVNREKEIQERITGTKLAIDDARSADPGSLDSLNRVLAESRTSYNELMDSLKYNFPDYYELKHQGQEEWSLSWLAEMEEGTALISYFIGVDSVYGFAAVQGQVFALNLISREELERRVEELRMALTNRKAITALAEELGAMILTPLLAEMDGAAFDRLVIFRDGYLEYIPFDILPLAGGYLIEKFPLSYGYNIRSYFRDQRPLKSPQNYLGFARSFSGDTYRNASKGKVGGKREVGKGPKSRDVIGLAELPFALEEVKDAEDLLVGRIFLDGEASETALRKHAEQGGILHLATHALLDDRNPLYSKLLLAGDASGEMEKDGDLHAYELFALNLGSELTILSACNTGNGQLQSGEGMMSLARGFAYAGCPSILMNHWEASDRESGVIINDFLEYLAEGLEKDAALQKAKVDYLKNADEVRAHPYFWAGLGLVGNKRAMHLNRSGGLSGIWPVGVVGFVVLILVFIGFRIKRKGFVRRAKNN